MINATKKWIFLKLSSVILVPLMTWFIFNLVSFYDKSYEEHYNLISALHSFVSVENEKYKNILPPLNLLTNKEQKELMLKLKELDFFPEKNIAA